jgi:hypothetical protein
MSMHGAGSPSGRRHLRYDPRDAKAAATYLSWSGRRRSRTARNPQPRSLATMGRIRCRPVVHQQVAGRRPHRRGHANETMDESVRSRISERANKLAKACLCLRLRKLLTRDRKSWWLTRRLDGRYACVAAGQPVSRPGGAINAALLAD